MKASGLEGLRDDLLALNAWTDAPYYFYKRATEGAGNCCICVLPSLFSVETESTRVFFQQIYPILHGLSEVGIGWEGGLLSCQVSWGAIITNCWDTLHSLCNLQTWNTALSLAAWNSEQALSYWCSLLRETMLITCIHGDVQSMV